jgi:hypothetical protein
VNICSCSFHWSKMQLIVTVHCNYGCSFVAVELNSAPLVIICLGNVTPESVTSVLKMFATKLLIA